MFYLWGISLLMVFLLVRLQFISKYYMSTLLVLESVMVSSLMITLYVSMKLFSGHSMFLILLTFIVCEAALGLTLLLTYIKVHGSDYINSVSSLN
uniref:NADH-ubiquinone oxidoreductase chain 4L n=1 Tax=Reinia monelasmus TaxID=1885841 RepID=A0A224ACD7_9EUPU|nr:NADH dehydrogenase subunit 4L [Reinia monelasmus]BBA10739.1 NADH dehydrogenase subunit 4L [Reinia monelasmus]